MDEVTGSGAGGPPRNPAILWCLVLAAGLAPFSPLAADEPLEYQVKAAFLLNFTKFVEWPAAAFESPGSPVSICVVGGDPFGSALNEIVAGEVVNGRKVAVKSMRLPPPPKSCQVVFIGRSEKEVPKIISGLGPGVLTVGEGDGFIRYGGVIAFVIENRRVRFDISQSAAEHAGLKLSSKLLNVARSVEK
jgi:hypothetical protein